MASQILLINTEQSTLRILTNLLKTEGYKVTATADVCKAKSLASSEKYDLLISGVTGENDAEMEAIKTAMTSNPRMRLVVITKSGAGALSEKVAALKPFATIETPLKVDKLMETVQKAVDYKDVPLAESVNFNLQLEKKYQLEDVVAESPAMKAICDMVNRISATDITVLIIGESGVGKESIARAIHAGSKRKDKPFIVVDCADSNAEANLMAPGVSALQEAGKGTVLLKDITALPSSAQEALLSVMRERKINGAALDARLLVTATKSIDEAVKSDGFNADLAKLVKIVPIKVPPLRDRKPDVMPTVRYVLRKLVGKDAALPALDQDVVKILESCPWTRNIASIEDAMAAALEKAGKSGRVTRDCLPSTVITSA